MTLQGTALIVLLTSGAATLPAAAHHSLAMYDDFINLPLEGVVTRFDYRNPHSWLYVSVTDEDGAATDWAIELHGPALLRRAGIGPRNWMEGDKVQIVTNPHRNGRPVGYLVASRNATQGNESGDVELIDELAAAEE